MEQQLRTWLRYGIMHGVYLGKSSDQATVPTPQQAWHDAPIRLFPNALIQRVHVCALLCAIGTLYIHGLYWRGSEPGLMLTWVAATVIFTTQICTNFLIIMEALWKQTEHETFLLLLDEIEVSLKLRLRQHVQPQLLCKIVRTHIIYLSALSFASLALFIVTSLWLNYIGYFWHGIWTIITMRLRIIQLIVYVRVLRHYLECLCTKLGQIEAYRTAPTQQLLDINYEKLASLECLVAIKDIYTQLHKAFHLLNSFAGWSLFSIIACYMFDFTCNLYWTLLSFDGFVRRRYYYIAGPAAMLPLIALICHLCYLCDNCTKLGRTMAHLLSKIVIMSSASSLRSYRLVLYQLSTQLQLQRIEVTAQHFFVLEIRFLMTIITAVAMNLVILIQFLNS
ncbi:putative gustatory receptor 39b [Zeugodacus cucurbitae]|uniref:putative gustatory receptor 39b n=1 Tax=Zeugodacus cucurbitae TaxID=28588 RepID=UPI0023D968B1|nr:putative gustatory receptor 39b [Zeugodacus cucurbitae]